MICEVWWKFYLFFIIMGTFTEMVTSFPWLLRSLTSLNSRVKEGPECCFLLPKSHGADQWHLLRVEIGLKERLGVQGPRPVRGAPSTACCRTPGLWRGRTVEKGQCMG